ncbi:hypothetical protein F4V91_06920 [Neorhizobium galegae]|uniref:Uncharacterized protein n=1 Tax=Neorhizobium galegae TaxID=399 RepID=A0A6A1TPT4_NEOGA|nr:hypothetical protein [Neorhizobium galegae]KAB1086190.1 hypothetical protein F4V91_06920 [Neorhizobium galegae]
MTDEKDKIRRISKMAREQRDRHQEYRLVDDLRKRGVFDETNARLDETMDQLRAESDRYLDAWAKAFLDFHPVTEQRTEGAMEAWAKMGKVDQKAMSAVIQQMIDSRASDPAKRAKLQAAHDRMTDARHRAAVYDGDVDRARPAYYVGPGWTDILDDLVREFAEIDGLGFLAAHEKWGELRIAYLYSGDRQADVDAIVKRAADRCLAACWYCGQAGRMRKERWWRVRCYEHWGAE